MMKKPSRPMPKPKTPMARRLETVRTEVGIVSLRAFWAKVSDGWRGEDGQPVSLSYEAVRTYHYDKPAPASYLARVAALFDYRLEWLITGVGSPQAGKAKAKANLTGIPEIEHLADGLGLSDPNRVLLGEAVTRACAGLRGGLSRITKMTIAMDLLTMLEIPAKHWGFDHAMSRAAFNDFATAMLHALMLALPKPGTGDAAADEGVGYAAGMSFTYAADHEEQLRSRIDELSAKLANLEAAKSEVEVAEAIRKNSQGES